jgi:type IX secretion system PorP/SprF family membrane protein
MRIKIIQNRKKNILIRMLFSVQVWTFSFFIINTFSFAQDLHFSQYNETPSLVNPALTGASHVLAASVIYKDQWRGVTVPYKTYGASFEMKFKASNWEKSAQNKTKSYQKSISRLAGGISFFSDKAGDGNMGTSQVNLSLASFVPLNKNNSLSVGLQASIVQRTIDFSKLIFPDQFNGLVYDPNSSNGENIAAQSYIYPDVAAGINWNYGYTKRELGQTHNYRANIGIAMYHINEPKQTFLIGGNERLAPKYVFHGNLLFGIEGTHVILEPSYLVQFQGPSKEILAGLMYKYLFQSDNSKYTGFIKQTTIGLGATYRNLDALIISTVIESGQYTFGFSYDLNTSKLTSASYGRGGPEIFLRFVTPNPYLYQMKTKARYKL